MIDLSMSALWTVAAVVFGFQLAALSWRITREIHMESQGQRTWLTVPDGIVMLSVLILVGGVFAAPILVDIKVGDAARLFGLSLTLFASAPVVLAGHYDLYRYQEKPKECRNRVTPQEWCSLVVPGIFSGAYVAVWLLL